MATTIEKIKTLSEGEGELVLSNRMSAEYDLEDGIFKTLQLKFRSKYSEYATVSEYKDVELDEFADLIRDFVFEVAN